ncbi:AlpA family phage regulatory protein [Salmonella enterica subsp. enterica]|nr:AlpA family phage regulatory protein [Salmonella enterica subsp. enterica]EEJ7209094.1 AlpA family phage regulatory protein [Salmonella enterica subsp. enterica]
MQLPDGVYSWADIRTKTGLSDMTIRRMMARNEFPASFNLSLRRVAWVKAEVDAWLKNQRNNKG